MVSNVEDSEVKLNNVYMGDMEIDTGFSLTAAVGKKFSNGFRGKIEYSYRKSNISVLQGSGSLRQYAMMLNAVYDLKKENHTASKQNVF